MPYTPPSHSWTKEELRLGILQVLYAAEQIKPGPGAGASPRMLVDCLNPIMFQMQDALKWLREQDFAKVSDEEFVITEAGKDYLIDGLGPGRLPPTVPSRVPRRPAPTTGETSIALPLPETNRTDET